MTTSKASQKRAQQLQARRNAGIPDDVAWPDMTANQRSAYLSESMKRFHQSKSNGNTSEHAVADSTSPTPGSVNGASSTPGKVTRARARANKANRSQRRLSYQQVVERIVDLVEESELYTPDSFPDELFDKAVDATKKVMETLHSGEISKRNRGDDTLWGLLTLGTIIEIAFERIEE